MYGRAVGATRRPQAVKAHFNWIGETIAVVGAWVVVLVLFNTAKNPTTIATALGAVILATVTIRFAYVAGRRVRHGECELTLDEAPMPGQPLRGRIATRMQERPDAVKLHLKYIHEWTTYHWMSARRHRRTHKSVEWETTATLDRHFLQPGPQGLVIPVALQLPEGAYYTDTKDRADKWYWTLEATADIPGIDFHQLFPLDVRAR